MDGMPIPDPYYGGLVRLFSLYCRVIEITHYFHNASIQNGFEKVFEQCTELSNAFLDKVVSSA